MIEQLIDLFDAAVTSPVTTKHGLAILGPDGPMKRTQTGQYTPIAVDNEAPWSYWRIGDIKSTPYDIYACSMGALQQVPLRLVLLLPNDCGHRDILLAAGARGIGHHGSGERTARSGTCAGGGSAGSRGWRRAGREDKRHTLAVVLDRDRHGP